MSEAAGSIVTMIYKVARGALRRTAASLRQVGLGKEHPHWRSRLALCQVCPILHTQCGRAYCGKPLLNKPYRDEATEGCGCPITLKSKDPAEHCPRDKHWAATTARDGKCTCVWCQSINPYDTEEAPI
jgi:hypothetical protein